MCGLVVVIQMDKLFHYKEIFPGNKKKHFANLRASSGIAYRYEADRQTANSFTPAAEFGREGGSCT